MLEVESACRTLGYNNGGFCTQIDMRNTWTNETEIPLWLDNVECESGSSDFLSCSSNGWGDENCSHQENILLTCFEQGNGGSNLSCSWRKLDCRLRSIEHLAIL